MDGLIYLLDQTGRALAHAERRIAELEAALAAARVQSITDPAGSRE